MSVPSKEEEHLLDSYTQTTGPSPLTSTSRETKTPDFQRTPQQSLSDEPPSNEESWFTHHTLLECILVFIIQAGFHIAVLRFLYGGHDEKQWLKGWKGFGPELKEDLLIMGVGLVLGEATVWWLRSWWKAKSSDSCKTGQKYQRVEQY